MMFNSPFIHMIIVPSVHNKQLIFKLKAHGTHNYKYKSLNNNEQKNRVVVMDLFMKTLPKKQHKP